MIILTENDKQLTTREVFNIVKEHLLSQGSKSIGEEGMCAYRGQDDCKCALGVLMTDECYHSDFEGKSIFYLLGEFGMLNNLNEGFLTAVAAFKHRVANVDVRFLSELQDVHDCSRPKYWKDELDHVENLRTHLVDNIYVDLSVGKDTKYDYSK